MDHRSLLACSWVLCGSLTHTHIHIFKHHCCMMPRCLPPDAPPGISPRLGPHLTSLQPYFRCSHLQICQNSRTPGVSCQQMARTSPASIHPPAVQALSLLPSTVLNRATGMLSHRSTQHRTQRASVHYHAHKGPAH